MARADKPIESDSDILDPITVKAEDADTEDQDDADQDADETPLAAQSQGTPQQSVPGRTTVPGQTAQPGQPQRQRGRSTWRDTIQKEVGKATKAHEQTIAELKNMIAQLQGGFQTFQQMGGRQQQDPQQPGGAKSELDGISQEMRRLESLATNPNLTEEQRAALGEQYRALDDKRIEARAAVVAERIVADKLKAMPQAPSHEESIGLTILTTEFPRLAGDATAKRETKAYYDYLVARNGGVETPDIFREACQYIYTQRGWASQPPRVNGRDRAAYESAPGNSRGGSRDPGDITFAQEDLRVMRGAPVSPEQVAEQMRMMKQRGW